MARAFRFRQYLTSIKPDEGEPSDDNTRQLEFKKNQYGPKAETVIVRYDRGLFLPLPGVTSLDKLAQERKAEDVFLDLLGRFTRANRFVGDKPSSNYAPALFAREDEAKRHALSKKVLEAAMRRLFQAKKIRNEPYGKPSRNSFHIVRTV